MFASAVPWIWEESREVFQLDSRDRAVFPDTAAADGLGYFQLAGPRHSGSAREEWLGRIGAGASVRAGPPRGPRLERGVSGRQGFPQGDPDAAGPTGPRCHQGLQRLPGRRSQGGSRHSRREPHTSQP